MKNLTRFAIATAALALSAAPGGAQKPAAVVPGLNQGAEELPVTQRNLPEYPLRLGGVFTSGLGDSPNLVSTRGAAGKLSEKNRDWIAANLDVLAVSASDIDTETFPALRKAQRLFTPLLYTYASTLYETDHRGNVGGWKPELQKETLLDADGREVLHPDAGGHWMDFGSTVWARHYGEQIRALTATYGAYGVVAAELPIGNTFVGDRLLKYRTAGDRARATLDWLKAVRPTYSNLLIPSALGFDLAANHDTPDTGLRFPEPALPTRLWNDYFALTDGAWCEGWLRPYWDDRPVSESLWETQMEAADRAGRIGQVFIACAAYSDLAELEYVVASFLLISHNQGRMVLQPMPLRPGRPKDAGFDLSVLQRELKEHRSYFRIPLGRGVQERHQMPGQGGVVWRRMYQFGDVYVNSGETRTVTLAFAGPMKRLDGRLTSKIVLPPHSGAVLLYTSERKGERATGRSVPVTPTKRRPRR